MAAQTQPLRSQGRAEAPGRPVIRSFSNAAAYTVVWDVRPVYDFVFSLSDEAGLTEDLPEPDRGWLADAKASMPDPIRATSDRLLGTELAIVIAGLAVDRPEITTAAAFVDALRSIDAGQVRDLILAEFLRGPETRALTQRATEGDATAVDELLASCDLGEVKGDLLRAVITSPVGVVDSLIEVLSAWQARFAEVEPRVAAMIRRDYEDRVGDRATLRGVELVEKTTGGVRWLAEPGLRRVILAPSYFARPYNFVLSAGDWRMFGYPIADSALDASDPLAPPLSVVRLHRALGDETRLRILKLLAGRDWYLSEIAQQLGLSKPTIKHHLALLRSAALVTMTEEAAVTYYSLRRPRLDDASSELRRFLTG